MATLATAYGPSSAAGGGGGMVGPFYAQPVPEAALASVTIDSYAVAGQQVLVTVPSARTITKVVCATTGFIGSLTVDVRSEVASLATATWSSGNNAVLTLSAPISAGEGDGLRIISTSASAASAAGDWYVVFWLL